MDRPSELAPAGDAAVLRDRGLRRTHGVPADDGSGPLGDRLRLRSHPSPAPAGALRDRRGGRPARDAADLRRSGGARRRRRLPLQPAAVVPRRVPDLPGPASRPGRSSRARAVDDDRSSRPRGRRRGRGTHPQRCGRDRFRQPRAGLAHAPAARILPRRRLRHRTESACTSDARRRGRGGSGRHLRAGHPLPGSHREHQPAHHRPAAGRRRAHHARLTAAGTSEPVEPQSPWRPPSRVHHAARHDDLPLAHAGTVGDGRSQRRLRDADGTRPPRAGWARVVGDPAAVARRRVRRSGRARSGRGGS